MLVPRLLLHCIGTDNLFGEKANFNTEDIWCADHLTFNENKAPGSSWLHSTAFASAPPPLARRGQPAIGKSFRAWPFILLPQCCCLGCIVKFKLILRLRRFTLIRLDNRFSISHSQYLSHSNSFFLSWASIFHQISSRTFWIFGILSQMSAWSFLRGSKDLLLPRMFDDPSQDELAEDDATDEDLFAIG